MFFDSKERLARGRMERRKSERRRSARFELLLFVQNSSGDWVKCYGDLGVGGCCFKWDSPATLGQTMQMRLVLVGTDTKVQARSEVVRVTCADSYVRVATRFEGLTLETKRMIACWLDLLSGAYGRSSVA